MEDIKFKVCVKCITYNHSLYIEDTMNGFVSQQTDFPFVCVIIDDASTDNEMDIINKYLNDFYVKSTEETEDYSLIYASFKNNSNCYFAVYFLKYNHFQIKKSKVSYFYRWAKETDYFAYCEGDDYWIDKSKLQKQVSFLDSHEDFSMCFSDQMDLLEDSTLRETPHRYKEDCEISLPNIILRKFIPTASVCHRSSFFPYPKSVTSQHIGDYPMEIYLGFVGRVWYFHNYMSVYRNNAVGSWSDRLRRKSLDELRVVWHNEVKLIEDMDTLTERKFHKTFVKRKHIYLYDKKMEQRLYLESLPHLIGAYNPITHPKQYIGYILSWINYLIKH